MPGAPLSFFGLSATKCIMEAFLTKMDAALLSCATTLLSAFDWRIGGGSPRFGTHVSFHRIGRKVAYARRVRSL
jgi:hypothetical protein